MVEVKSTAGMVIGSMEFEEFWLVENVVGTQTTYELIWMNFTSVMARTIVECDSPEEVVGLIRELKECPEAAERYGLSFAVTSQFLSADDFAMVCSN